MKYNTAMPPADAKDGQRKAAREIIDILHEISVLLVRGFPSDASRSLKPTSRARSSGPTHIFPSSSTSDTHASRHMKGRSRDEKEKRSEVDETLETQMGRRGVVLSTTTTHGYKKTSDAEV